MFRIASAVKSLSPTYRVQVYRPKLMVTDDDGLSFQFFDTI